MIFVFVMPCFDETVSAVSNFSGLDAGNTEGAAATAGAGLSPTPGPMKLAHAGNAIIQVQQTFTSVITGLSSGTELKMQLSPEEMGGTVGELLPASSSKRESDGDKTLHSLFMQPNYFKLMGSIPDTAIPAHIGSLAGKLFGPGSAKVEALKRVLEDSDPAADIGIHERSSGTSFSAPALTNAPQPPTEMKDGPPNIFSRPRCAVVMAPSFLYE